MGQSGRQRRDALFPSSRLLVHDGRDFRELGRKVRQGGSVDYATHLHWAEGECTNEGRAFGDKSENRLNFFIKTSEMFYITKKKNAYCKELFPDAWMRLATCMEPFSHSNFGGEKISLSLKLHYFKVSCFSLCFILSTALQFSKPMIILLSLSKVSFVVFTLCLFAVVTIITIILLLLLFI